MINEETKRFILEHEDEDPTKVIFKAASLEKVDGKVAAQQISARKKAKKKIPSWYSNEEIIFPSKTPLEQSSSEQTALYKASLLQGNTIADLTGGMGIDDWAFTTSFQKVFYCERQVDLAEIAKHNFSVLEKKNIEVFSGDSIEWLTKSNHQLDVVYLDPARRDAQNNKMVGIADCEPNLLELKDAIFKQASKILVKLSPMLDIRQAVRELENVAQVWVIAVENECKEILFLLENKINEKVPIHCIDFKKNNEIKEFTFNLQDEEYLSVDLAKDLEEYLYEPNVSILKSGGFKSIANKFDLRKLEMNSHLYTSNTLLEDFPGRKFLIREKVLVQKKALKKSLPHLKANLSIRNFPQSVDQLRKKLKLKEGGEDYLFATTIMNNEKVLLLCDRINK